ncbi:MAG: BatA domain-containing protein, partial [Opitutaceae bacterium]
MNFLAPLFLIGALAVAGPVIYHLVRRTTRERLPFGSLIFLRPSPPRLSQRHRFEHLLLLILRCLALALLAFAFARPFLPRTPDDDPSAARPARLVVLLDTSASMRREGVWPAVVARANDWIRRAGPADELTLMTFDRAVATLLPADEWRRAAAGDRAALAAARVAALKPGWGSTRLGSALAAAAEALADAEGKTAPGPRRIVLVSDLQAGSRLDALQAYEWPKGVELLLEPVAASRPTNAGVQVMADGPDVARPADAPARVRVSNAADAKREQFQIGWGTGEAGGARIDAYVPPGQSRVFLLPRVKGIPADTVTLTGDDEDFDNRSFAIPPVQQRPQVVWLGADAPDDAKQPLFFV